MKLNYLLEVIAFGDWLETNPLSTPAIALWYTLMHVNNKAGWIDQFAVANSLLMAKLEISKPTLHAARNKLIQVGRIEYRNNGKQQAGTYRMIPFGDGLSKNILPPALPPALPSALLSALPNTAPLFKEKETKENKTASAADADVFRLFESEGFGTLSSVMAEKLNDFIDTYSAKWTAEAMKRSALAGIRKLNYVEGILKSWKSQGLESPWESEKKPIVVKDNRNARRTNSKKALPFVQVKLEEAQMSDEELTELEELARRLDGN